MRNEETLMLEEYQRVYAVVDLDAIRHNIGQIEERIADGTKIMAVIKADGYGHGAVRIAKELEALPKVSGYGVATAEEAFALRDSGILKPILILGYTFPYHYEALIEQDIRMAVFREDTLEQLSVCAGKSKKKAKIHVKVDTGMSRIGILPDMDGIAFVKKTLAYREIEVEGIFTHFARADERDKTSAKMQLDRMSQFINRIETETGYRIPVKHCSNSAGILELKEANMDMVRAGIILYGLLPSDEIRRDGVSLMPALSLKSHIVYRKNVEKGVPISYGGTYVTERPMRIATIPVGYGDGYPRGLSNKGYVLIHGKRAPILGRVCMDQFMVSVEDIPEAKEGDEVTLIGSDGSAQITMEELGELSGRFNYELACCLGARIPRVYRKDGKIL
ncbi:MAG: alanine racemase [Blautia sp.]|nr:alanine racemase [Lachnoclostridium sp.]MCM1211258.1 alanine racemase [Blautia sp.]